MSYSCEKKLEVFVGNVREYRISCNTRYLVEGCGNEVVKINHDGFELLFNISYTHSITEDKNTLQHCWSWQKIVLKECPNNLEVNFRMTGTSNELNTIRLTSNYLESKMFLKTEFATSRRRLDFYIIIEVSDIEDERALMLAYDYDKLFKNEQSSDVIFMVDEEEIKAHKLILSTRSEVFARMLESDMLEKQNGRVVIKDIDADTFKLLLRFIYCGQLENIEAEELLKLTVAADKYCVKSLIITCEYRLQKKLRVENAMDVFVTSDALKLDFLKKMSMNFIIKKKKEIVGTEDFNKLIKSRGDLISELFMSLEL